MPAVAAGRRARFPLAKMTPLESDDEQKELFWMPPESWGHLCAPRDGVPFSKMVFCFLNVFVQWKYNILFFQ